jgi:hypothetical protein
MSSGNYQWLRPKEFIAKRSCDIAKEKLKENLRDDKKRKLLIKQFAKDNLESLKRDPSSSRKFM